MHTWQRISLWQIGLVLLTGVTLLSVPLASDAHASHIACGDTLGPGGSFMMDTNIGPCAGQALTLVGPVLLDMKGRRITCEDDAFGVRMEGRGAQLRNGTIDNCLTGVDLDGMQHRVTRVTVFPGASSTAEPFLVWGTGRHNLTDNDVFCAGSERAISVYSNLNTLTMNVVDGCTTAYFVRGSRNILTRNSADVSSIGYQIGGDSNTLTSNRAETSDTAYLIEGERNVLRSNGVSNVAAGIGYHAVGNLNQFLSNSSATMDRAFVVDSDRNRVIGNSIALNDAAAITVTGQSNLMQNNRAGEPVTGAAFVDTNVNCDANRWVNNAGSGNQPCVE